MVYMMLDDSTYKPQSFMAFSVDVKAMVHQQYDGTTMQVRRPGFQQHMTNRTERMPHQDAVPPPQSTVALQPSQEQRTEARRQVVVQKRERQKRELAERVAAVEEYNAWVLEQLRLEQEQLVMQMNQARFEAEQQALEDAFFYAHCGDATFGDDDDYGCDEDQFQGASCHRHQPASAAQTTRHQLHDCAAKRRLQDAVELFQSDPSAHNLRALAKCVQKAVRDLSPKGSNFDGPFIQFAHALTVENAVAAALQAAGRDDAFDIIQNLVKITSSHDAGELAFAENNAFDKVREDILRKVFVGNTTLDNVDAVVSV